MPQNFRSKWLPNQGVISGSSGATSLGDKVIKHRQLIFTFVPVHLVGIQPNQGVDIQPFIGQSYMGKMRPQHLQVALAENLSDTVQRHLFYDGHGESVEFPGELPPAAFPGRSKTDT